MKVSCPTCQTNYNIDDKRIPPGGAKLKCARCQNTFPIRAASEGMPTPVAIPLPGSAAPQSAAIPLPGSAAPQSAAIPLPGSAAPQSAAIPLPGMAAPRATAIPLPGAAAAPAAAIPLPGSAAPRATAIPLPGSAAPQPAAIPLPGSAAPMSAAIPLPGFAAPVSAAIPLPGAAEPQDDPFAAAGGGDYSWDESESTRVVALSSLPSAAYRESPTETPAPVPVYSQEPPGTARDFDFSDEPAPEIPVAEQGNSAFDSFGNEPSAQDAIPLPGMSDFGEDSMPEAQTFELTGSEDSEDPFALPPPPAYEQPHEDSQQSAPAEEDPFSLAPAPAAEEHDPFALPPPSDDPFTLQSSPDSAPASAASDDIFALAPPSGPGASHPEPEPSTAFAFPPPPESSEPDPFSVDLSDPLPSAPEPDMSLDFGDLPTPAAPPPPAPTPAPAPVSAAPINVGDFGDVSFDDPPSSADSLEFDPTAASAPAGDDLEVDLSSPLPPPPTTGNADGLEMLSFIDDAAKESHSKGATKVKRFHVRRRSGKVFGPFEEGVIVKMLEEGQLLGNEDVSTDSDNWIPIGTVASFATAIQKLMEGPASKTGLPAVTSGEPASQVEQSAAPNPNASMDRMKQLYEGRMASVAVVDRSGSIEKWRKRMPYLIGAGVTALVLIVGGSFSFTKYGAFGMRKLFPPRVAAGSAAAAQVDTARAALLQDTFISYQQARDLTGKVLETKEYPEVRATWCQAIYYLQRRYAAAEQKQLTQCQNSREAFDLLGEKNMEAVKATAGAALSRRLADEALPGLKNASSRDANSQDVELAFLLAEAQSIKHQDKEAIATLDKVLKTGKGVAKAQHMLGNLNRDSGHAEEAAKAYEAALQADPTHVISAVELAAVELLLLKGDPAKGLDAVERALDEKAMAGLGPAEIARARSLKGVALAAQFKFKEAETELRDATQKDPNSLFIKAQLARVLRANRDFAGALPIYEAAVKEESGVLEYTEGYISSLLALGKVVEASKAVEAANTRFTNDARIALLYARIDDARDSLASAEGHYQRAIKADANLFEANLYLGRFYLRLRRNAEARAQLEEAAKKAPDDAGVRAGLGELALTENKVELAEQQFEKSAQLNPSLAEAYLGLSRVALLGGDLEKAKVNANKALELDPHLLKDGRLQRGTVLWRLGQLDEAVTELEKAKQEDPRSVTIPITLGAVLYEKGDMANAEKNLSLAITREPSNHEALYYLALVKAKRAEYTGAIEQMKLAVEKAPNRPDYHFAMGDIYRKDERFAEAIAEWKKTIELDPKDADAYEALGRVYLDTGKIEDAISSLESALSVDPKRKRVLGAIGDAFFSAGRWDEAVRRYEKALKEAPELTYVYYKIGRAWSERDQHTKAIDWYKKAVAAEPGNAMAYYYLGFSYKDKNKKKDAAASFRKYLELKPNADDKREIEDEIAALE